MKNCSIDTRNFALSIKRAANESKTSRAVVKLLKQFLRDVDANRGIFTTQKPVDLWKLAEECGIDVELAHSKHDGEISKCSARDTYVIIINSKCNPRRQYFTLAHELGHYILMQKIPEYYAELSSGKSTAIEESMCNLIAAELLMPIRYTFPLILKKGINPQGLSNLLDVFKVSKQVLFRRITKIISFYYGVNTTVVHWDVCGPSLKKTWATESEFDLSTLVLGFDFSTHGPEKKERFIEDRLLMKNNKLVHVLVGSIFINPTNIVSLVWPKDEAGRIHHTPREAPTVERFFNLYFSSSDKPKKHNSETEYDHPLISKIQEKLPPEQFRDLESMAESSMCTDLYGGAISRHKNCNSSSTVYKKTIQLELLKLLRSRFVESA